jgi:hypothetical protein
MPLDTLANVKRGLSITASADDDHLDQLQAAADAFVVMHCGRDFAGGSFTEYFPGGDRTVIVRNYPIATVTSVKVDPAGAFGANSVRDPADYAVHATEGIIESKAGPFGAVSAPRAVQVVYTTATGQVPAAVQRAYADLIGHWYREAKTRAATGQLNLRQSTASGSITEYAWGQSGGYRIPAGVLQLLVEYRVPAG